MLPETPEPGGPTVAVPGRRADPGGEDGEGRARIGDDGNFGGDRLADLGGVDVDVHDPRVAGVGVEVPGHPVVEAHADREDHVRLVGEHVGAVVAVHAEKTDVERVMGRQGGEAEEGEADREPAALRHLAELRLRPGESDPMTGEDIGARGAVEETGGRLALQGELTAVRNGRGGRSPARSRRTLFSRLQVPGGGPGGAGIGGGPLEAERRRPGRLAFRRDGRAAARVRSRPRAARRPGRARLGVAGDVEQHRTGLAGEVLGTRPGDGAACDRERHPHRPRDLRRIRDLPRPAGRRQAHADRVRLLERIGSELRARHLPGDRDERGRVHEGVGEGGEEVGGPRAGGPHAHTGPTRRPGVALRGMACPLLVSDEHVADPVPGAEERVVDRHVRAPGIAEHEVRAFGDEGLHQQSGAVSRPVRGPECRHRGRPPGGGRPASAASPAQGPEAARRRPLRSRSRVRSRSFPHP